MRPESNSLDLPVSERHGIRKARPRRPVAVDFVIVVRKSERYPADHAPVVAKSKMAADQTGLTRQRRLRDAAKTERLRGQHEISDIGPAIDRTINAERFVGVDDGNVRRAEEFVILKRLLGIGGFVAARDAERVVELEATFPAALEVDAAIFARKRKVAIFRRAGTDRGVNLLAKAFPGFATCDHHLPRLAVAPGRGALRRRQYPLNGGARYRLGLERAAGIAFAQQLFEHFDRRVIGVAVHCVIASVGTVSRTRCSVL